jgi:RNA polymerase sigma factor (sigma-70 family)
MSYEAVGPLTPALDAAVVAAFEAHHAHLVRFVTSYSGPGMDPEDIVQEAFARLLREARSGRLPADARAWLYTVSVNLARSRARRALVANRARKLLAVGAPTFSPEQEVERRGEFDALRQVVARLPHDRRTAFLLAVDGFTGPQIAAVMNRSPTAVRQLIWRAREAIRAEMEAER